VVLPVAFPAEIVMLAGTESRAELEFSDTVVFAETACDSVTKKRMLPPEMTPVTLRSRPTTERDFKADFDCFAF
jgi:hypothetical protein